MAQEAGFSVLCLDPIGGYYSLKSQITIKYYWQKWEGSRKLILLSLLSKIYGRIMVKLDSLDRSNAKKKFTIYWVMVIKK
jgi:hypothetical protein